MRTASVTAFAGVKGTITLAGILTLPLAMPNGAAFPARDLVIFLAMGVILLSLVIASITLPTMTAGMTVPQVSSSQELEARTKAAEAAIRRVEQLHQSSVANASDPSLMPEATARVLNLYRRRLTTGITADDRAQQQRLQRQQAQLERNLQIEALHAERDELYRLLITHQIEDALHRQLVYEIDLMEAALSRQG